MGIDHAGELGAHGLRFGRVDADAGAAGLGAEVEHVEGAPRAGDDRRQPARRRSRWPRARASVARRAVEQLETARDGVGALLASTARA